MCLVLPARVIAIDGQHAVVELHGGMRASANIALHPDVAVGQYVLVDRGLVLEVIEAAEAEAIIGMYDEIGQLLEEADAAAEPPADAEGRAPVPAEGREPALARPSDRDHA